MSELSIGSKIRVKDYNDIPEEFRTKALGRLCGEIGTIDDIVYSMSLKCKLYVIKFDNYDVPSKKMWRDEMLEEVVEEDVVTYTFEFEFLENLVVARLYEVTGDTKTELEKGHGHIFHDGAVGIAQAASYAMKKLYYKLAGMED